MKFLIDENVGESVTRFLVENGYDIVRAKDLSFREDHSLVDYAFNDNRIIITNDKDFGFLIYRQMLPSRGVILFRLSREIPSLKISALEITLTKFSYKLLDHFTVISDDKIRIRSLITFKESK